MLTNVDVSVKRLNLNRYEYVIVLASDGMWNVLAPSAVKVQAKMAFTPDKFKPNKYVMHSPKSLADVLCHEARVKWAEVSHSILIN